MHGLCFSTLSNYSRFQSSGSSVRIQHLIQLQLRKEHNVSDSLNVF